MSNPRPTIAVYAKIS